MDKNIVTRRFAELLSQADELAKTKKHNAGDMGYSFDSVDEEQFIGWKVKARNLLSIACGNDSEHYKDFKKLEGPQSFRDSWQESQQLRAVLQAAQEDFEGGYITTLRAIVQAEVYDSEIDQARGLLSRGYHVPAAVVAGVVLETAIRQLCANRGIVAGKLDKMNADLCKAGLYTLLVQKRITALADIRNNAAHGHPEKFNRDDVDDMIRQVERFLADYPA